MPRLIVWRGQSGFPIGTGAPSVVASGKPSARLPSVLMNLPAILMRLPRILTLLPSGCGARPRRPDAATHWGEARIPTAPPRLPITPPRRNGANRDRITPNPPDGMACFASPIPFRTFIRPQLIRRGSTGPAGDVRISASTHVPRCASRASPWRGGCG